MREGLFITMEGPDGSGKSTQLGFIKEYFCEKNLDVLFTREPGGTSISEKIRQLILDKDNSEMDEITEAYLYAASRAQLVAQVIKPKLSESGIVICDRYVDSSIAYQGYGRGLGDVVEKINEFAVADCMPDVTFLLKVDADRGLKRIEEDGSSRSEKDRIELAGLDFHRRVLKGYLSLEEKNKERIIAIDASLTPGEVFAQIKVHLDRILREKYGL